MFSIEANFNMADIEAAINDEVNEWFQELAELLCQAGERAKNRAKIKSKMEGGFGNITFNLRSSIGWLVQVDGKEYKMSFTAVSGGAEGVKAGKDYARSIAKDYASGIVLLFVAGMDYAIYVESKDKNRDVIEGSSLILQQELEKELR